MDIAEIHFRGAGNNVRLPVCASIDGAHESSVGAARPYDTLVDGAHAPESSGRAAFLLLPDGSDGGRHFFHSLGFGKAGPAVSAAGAVHDARVSRRIGFLEKVVEHVDGIVQVIAVRVADRYMDFPAKLRAERFPVLLEDEAKIIFLPVFDDGPVDHAGLRIPEGYRPAALASWALWAIGRVPRTPLLARHRPAIAGAHDVFHLAFMPNREFDATVHIALAQPFHSLVVEVGVLVRVNVDELEPAKIYAVRAGRPHGVEEIRVKNLQRERNPAPRGPAIENAR